MALPPETFAVILMGLWGACVGSFLNVVIYRVPEGLSVISPPSRCPGCEKKLAWFDNVPVLGWLWLRGRCRNCKMRISGQYPLVEAFTALAFAGLTWVYYFTDLRPVFAEAGVLATWPVLGVHLVLLACMIAATVIDAKLYIIPLGIVWTASLVALVMPVSLLVGVIPTGALTQFEWWESLVPLAGQWNDAASGAEFGAAMGGSVGLVVAVALLRRGVLPLSFAEDPALSEGVDADGPDAMFVHPHPRREVLKEVLFGSAVLVGAALGVLAVMSAGGLVVQLAPVNALAGVLLGYLIGGGVVWAIRIFGTLLFGKEAMGLGDVHLMAAVGAVIGWRDATLAFFIAPFIGIAVVVVMTLLGSVFRGSNFRGRVIPYGPSLCVATVVVMVFRNEIWAYLLPAMG